MKFDPKFIHVEAAVRYWEDAAINGEEDINGNLMPFIVDGIAWCPTIEIETGTILGWPSDKIAYVHYKVCDAGRYFICNKDGIRTHEWRGDYVPDEYLCHGDKGFGDYIIMEIGNDGRISNYKKPNIDESDWKKFEDLT